MIKNSYFNINRIGYLLIRQLRFSLQTLSIGFGAMAGFIVFVLSMKAIFGQIVLGNDTFYGLVMPFFFIGGYVFTSNIFSELRTSQRGYLYLTLPASTLEKLIVSWFITSVLYVAASIVVIFSINIILKSVVAIFSANQVPIINLFSPSVLIMFAVYIVTQSVFLLGAIYFRRVNFFKTLLSLFVIIIVIAMYTSLTARLIVFHNFQSIHFDNNMPENWQNFFENIFAPVINAMFWYCFAPFFLIVSYFSLKERQV